MRHYLLLFALFISFAVHTIQAQQLHVLSFMVDPRDATARTEQGSRKDENNHLCALVKVRLVNAGAQFVATDLIEASELKVNQYWLYMLNGAKNLEVNVQGFEPLSLRFQEINSEIVSLEGGVVYVLSLSTNQDPTKEVTMQYLEFQVSPTDALLEVDGNPWPLDNGYVARPVRIGTHNYRITAYDHHTEEGHVAVYDTENRTSLNIQLKPSYGWLDIMMNLDSIDQSLTIYADNKSIGHNISAVSRLQMTSGQHQLRIISNLYKPYEETFTITDGQVTTLKPSLQSNYAAVTLSVAENAEIWLNKEMVGRGQWSGKLISGEYMVETVLPNRPKSSRLITIDAKGPTSIQLDAPGNYHGSLAIGSTPVGGARLLIDGESKGTTPMIVNNLSVGQHQIELKKEGYGDAKMMAEVERDVVKDYTITLEPVVSNTISNSRSIDNTLFQDIASKPTQTVTSPSTAHVVRETTKQEDNKQQSRRQQSTPQESAQQRSSRKAENLSADKSSISFYAQAGYQLGSLSGLNVNIDTYIKNFNIEAGMTIGLTEIKEDYNNISCKPLFFGAKLGYGINIAQGFRLTPQVGIGNVSISGSEFADRKELNGYAVIGVVAMRIDYAINRHLGINLTPQFNIYISKSPKFEEVIEHSSKIKGLGTGFNARLGLYYIF